MLVLVHDGKRMLTRLEDSGLDGRRCSQLRRANNVAEMDGKHCDRSGWCLELKKRLLRSGG